MAELKVIGFKTPKDWEAWLAKNAVKSPGIWLKLAKKDSGIISINYAQALDGALCHGWIDSQKKGLDATHWLQRFGPRKGKSLWSKINQGHVARLIKAGKMKAAGLEHVASAKKDGRWKAAYHSQSRSEVPADLEAALKKNAKAREFFATLNSANRYAILFRLQTAKKAETRTRRLEQFVVMLQEKRKLHG